jgi:hypothetical protein
VAEHELGQAPQAPQEALPQAARALWHILPTARVRVLLRESTVVSSRVDLLPGRECIPQTGVRRVE